VELVLMRNDHAQTYSTIKKWHADVKIKNEWHTFDEYKVKNPRPEDVALFGAPWKGAERVPSGPGVVGVVE